MKIAIVKYNAGNVFSVECALRRLGVEPVLTADPDVLRAADKVVFPGVGEASSAMTCLRGGGLDGVIRSLRQPVLGVCIGQQLMCRHSEEGDCDCLGIFDVDVKRFSLRRASKFRRWVGTLSRLCAKAGCLKALPTAAMSIMCIVTTLRFAPTR